jgi:hypothetical protein
MLASSKLLTCEPSMDIISFITPQIAVLGLVALVLSGGGEAGRGV